MKAQPERVDVYILPLTAMGQTLAEHTKAEKERVSQRVVTAVEDVEGFQCIVVRVYGRPKDEEKP